MHGGTKVGANGVPIPSSVSNLLYYLDSDTFKWNPLANGPAVVYHSACYLSQWNSLVIFGGRDAGGQTINSMYIYNITTTNWEFSPSVSPALTPR